MKNEIKILPALAAFLSVPAAQAANQAPNLKKITIETILAMLLLSQIAAAAANDTFQMPSFSQGWSSLPENVAGMAIKVLGIIFALVVIVVLANVLRGGGEVSMGRMGHDSGQSAGGMDRIIRSVAAIILLLIGVALVIWLVS